MSGNRIHITGKIECGYGTLVPSLRLQFTAENKTANDISIQNMNYTLILKIPSGVQYVLGTGVINKDTGYGRGELIYWTIKPNRTDHFESNFELGYTKLGEIERIRKENQGNRKLEFIIRINGHFVQLLDKDDSGRENVTSHCMFGAELERIQIDRGDWTDWLNQWGRNMELIEISHDLKAHLDEMKTKWHKLDHSDVIHTLLDLSGAFVTIPEFPFKKGLVKSMLGEGELKPKVEEMISKAEELIQISGWLDTTYLNELKKKSNDGIEIQILTKKPNNTSPKPVKTAYEKLPQIAEVKRNTYLHSRMIIVDKKEVLIATSDFTNHSLTQNFEIGYWTNNPSVAGEARNFFEKMWMHEDTVTVGLK